MIGCRRLRSFASVCGFAFFSTTSFAAARCAADCSGPGASCGDGDATAPDADGTDDQVEPGPCVIADGAPDYLSTLVCADDFEALASEPLDTSLPGARSVKIVMDRVDGNALYFQHSTRFELHYEFVSTHLSGGALPIVPDQATFNATEYFSPNRRFLLAAVTLRPTGAVRAGVAGPVRAARGGSIRGRLSRRRRRAHAQAGVRAEQGHGQRREGLGIGGPGEHEQGRGALAQGAGEGGAEGVGDDDDGVGLTQATGERRFWQRLARDLDVVGRSLGDEDRPGRIGLEEGTQGAADRCSAPCGLARSVAG